MDPQPLQPGPGRMVAMVAASGAVQAVPTILSMLPNDFTAPIVVIVAMPDMNVGIVTSQFAEKSRLPVAAAEEGQILGPGKVYVAGTDRRLLIEQGRLRFTQREPRVFDTMDSFLRSMARVQGTGAVAVVLSGMGLDGVAGIKEIRDAGGYTIAQDQATSLVYVKARHAVQLGAVCETLPLERIAPRLVELVASSSE